MIPHGSTLDISCTYPYVPDGFTIGKATGAELKLAGFQKDIELGERKPGDQPLDEMIVTGTQLIEPALAAQILRDTYSRVLRDAEENIVATWDEGRWWTPDESAEFLRLIVADLAGENDG